MADHQDNISQEIPKGFCQCGCGQKTKISQRDHKLQRHVKGEPLQYIHGHHPKGDKHPNWKGGRLNYGSHPRIYCPGHPRSGKRNDVFEHILIAERALGKSLPEKAVVHHHSPEQLVICQNQAYHLLLHQRQKALDVCGHVKWRKCPYCQQYDDPNNMYIHKEQTRHRHCFNAYMRKWKKH